MKFLNLDTFFWTFKVICVLTTTCLVGFWINKFMKNEDVSMIEYQSVEAMEDAVLPEMSFCFSAPISDVKLKAVGGNISIYEYAISFKACKFMRLLECCILA